MSPAPSIHCYAVWTRDANSADANWHFFGILGNFGQFLNSADCKAEFLAFVPGFFKWSFIFVVICCLQKGWEIVFWTPKGGQFIKRNEFQHQTINVGAIVMKSDWDWLLNDQYYSHNSQWTNSSIVNMTNLTSSTCPHHQNKQLNIISAIFYELLTLIVSLVVFFDPRNIFVFGLFLSLDSLSAVYIFAASSLRKRR